VLVPSPLSPFPLSRPVRGGARTYQVAPLNSRPVAQLILLIFTPPSCVFSHYFSSGFALCFYSINTPVLQTPLKYFVPHLTSVLGLELALHLRHNQLRQRIYTSVFYKTPDSIGHHGLDSCLSLKLATTFCSIKPQILSQIVTE